MLKVSITWKARYSLGFCKGNYSKVHRKDMEISKPAYCLCSISKYAALSGLPRLTAWCLCSPTRHTRFRAVVRPKWHGVWAERLCLTGIPPPCRLHMDLMHLSWCLPIKAWDTTTVCPSTDEGSKARGISKCPLCAFQCTQHTGNKGGGGWWYSLCLLHARGQP